MRGFVVDETYRIEGDKTNVYLFGRLENGESFMTVNAFIPYFAIKTSDLAKKVPGNYTTEDVPWRTMAGEPVTKIIVASPKDVPPLRKAFENQGVACYEADIRFTQRFLIDHGILRSLDIEGEYTKDDYVNRVYREPTLKPAEWVPSLRLLSFDIETTQDTKQIYSISLVCKDEHKNVSEVLIAKKGLSKIKNAHVFADEKSMLLHFRQAVLDCDPDIITGWNTIDFDLAVLKRKFAQHGIPFRMARQDWDCTLRLESSFMKESTAEFPGRQVLDGIQMLKLNFVSLPNYKLDTAAHELLGQSKLIGQEQKGEQIDEAYRNDPQKLVDYNLKDSELVLDILEKTNVRDIMITRSMLTGMPLERVRGSIASFDSLYLRELRKRNFVAPSSSFTEKEESISGGYVMQGKPGIYENIIVCDFKSLYPSLMRTFNIDPLAFEQGRKLPKTKAIVAPNGAQFSREQGILPELLERLWHARDEAKKKKDKRKTFAIKILMNSFFGVLAAPACRFFSMEMANAITGYGRHFIQLTIKKVEEMGYEVIYSDTDSVFIDAKLTSHAETEKVGEEITKSINAFYKEHIKHEYDLKSHLELQADKIFVHFIMPKVRNTEEGAKKRYAGLVLDANGKEELVVTGLEIVRRDWTDLSKHFQERMLKLVFAKEDPTSYVKEFIKELKSGKLDDGLIYRKAIRKDLEGYTKTTPPHVKAARLLEAAGQDMESSMIEYVMTTEGPYPVQLLGPKAPPIDYDHYVEKQLRPIADGILVFFGTNFDDLVKGSSQKTLFGY